MWWGWRDGPVVRPLAAPTEDPSLVIPAPTWQPTSVCNSRSREYDSLFCLHRHCTHTECTHTCVSRQNIHTHKKLMQSHSWQKIRLVGLKEPLHLNCLLQFLKSHAYFYFVLIKGVLLDLFTKVSLISKSVTEWIFMWSFWYFPPCFYVGIKHKGC